MTPVPATARKPKLLLVEDDASVRRALQLLLHGRGWDVRAHGSADAALSDPFSGDAALLVADYRLAGTDGIDLLLRLRARGWQGRAILITGYPSKTVDQAATDAGYAAVLEKPLSDVAFPETIRYLLLPGKAD